MRISDEDYNAAWKDEDNIKVMRKAVEPFKRILSSDQRLESMHMALFRCMKGHNHTDQKFTTSLYRFTKWECQNAARNLKRQERKQPVSLMCISDIVEDPKDDMSDVYECMDMLEPSDQQLIQNYYLDQMTLEEIGNKAGYTRQAALWNVRRAVDRLREICLDD